MSRASNLAGFTTSISPPANLSVGIITASSVINVGTGLTLSSGGINITGVITATSFSGNGSGLTGAGIGTTGSVNTSGIITATSFFGSGSGLTGVGLGTTGSINTSGIITATSFFGSGSGLTGVGGTSVFAAGSAAAPSISPTGDSNTGIFFPSADTIAFAEGGAEALRVDSSGRLLIGTTTATGANLLQVNSDARINSITVGLGGSAVNGNTVVGSSALSANTTGANNTAYGYQALETNTTGGNNTAIGLQALEANTTGSDNTAIGLYALKNNTTGGNNTATGRESLLNNTTGAYNTADGYNALYSNTTGARNVAVGQNALRDGTTSSNNTAIGMDALIVYVGTAAQGYNTALGDQAGKSVTTGTDNTLLGAIAGGNITTGSNNIVIGSNTTAAAAGTSNVITLGGSSIATLRCQVTTITALSDARDKTNITNIPAGLDFINALRPVAFDWNMRDGGKVGIHEFGFIAQELQEAQASTGITVPNLVSTENPDKLEASAGTLLPVLVNAVQELTAMVRDLQAELSILKGA